MAFHFPLPYATPYPHLARKDQCCWETLVVVGHGSWGQRGGHNVFSRQQLEEWRRGGGRFVGSFQELGPHTAGSLGGPFFAFFSYTCLATPSLRGSQPLAFSSCWPRGALPPQSLGLFLLTSCRSPGVTLRGSPRDQTPTLLPPPAPSQHNCPSRPLPMLFLPWRAWLASLSIHTPVKTGVFTLGARIAPERTLKATYDTQVIFSRHLNVFITKVTRYKTSSMLCTPQML